MANNQGLRQLVKDASENPVIFNRLQTEPAALFDHYNITGKQRDALASTDPDAIQALLKLACGKIDPTAILIIAVGEA